MDCLQHLSKSDQHWYDLIQQCRTSGMSDHQWLEANNIKSGTFYYHVKQLRKKACDIPENTCIGRSHVQEVVPLVVEDTMSLTVSKPEPDTVSVPVNKIPLADNSVAVRLNIHGISVEIANHATQEIIQNTLSALRFVC